MSAANQALQDFRKALESQASVYEVELSPSALDGLSRYFELLSVWNPRLHLVAPCSPTELATRHILESLLLLRHISPNATVADLGSGAGLPIIPCLIVRPDIKAMLFEATKKKAVFLREALNQTDLLDSATVVAERFESVSAPAVDYVSCRALEQFQQMLPVLLNWSPPESTVLLFGGENLRKKFAELRVLYTARQIPQSHQRFLFVITPADRESS